MKTVTFTQFVNENPWKSQIIGVGRSEVQSKLGQPTDHGWQNDFLFKFGDIEVGFAESGGAFYVQIDFTDGLKAIGTTQFPLGSWPIKGGMELSEIEDILKGCGCEFTLSQPEINPDMDEIHTESGLIFM